jgi:plasmid maintenance system antidote protein VapI
VLARKLTIALDKTKLTADEARAIARAHDADWRAWMLVANAVPLEPSGEAEAARARACEIAAANPALSPPPELCAKLRAAPSSR